MMVIAPSMAIADRTIRLGSWNLEHLGYRDHGQHPAAIAQHIRLAGVDILVLQEIYNTNRDSGLRSNKVLDRTFNMLNRDYSVNWKYALLPNKKMDDTSQLLAIAWNENVVRRGKTFRIPVQYLDESSWDRHPHAIKFSTGPGKSDLVVIPLHMKSNYDGEEIGLETRKNEARALVRILKDVGSRFADQDIILLGDTNCMHGDELALSIFASAGFIDLNKNDVTTYHKGNFKSPYDRILVPKDQPETKYSYQYVLTPANPKRHMKRLSDHYMIVAAIRILDDDD